MNKVLTISIAAYNVESTLTRTIESLVDCKSIDKLQIIVVNDGSKDSTLTIAESFAERFPDIVQVIDKANGGYGSTINTSISLATGKYFRLLDGDDEFITENIDEYLTFLEQVKCDVVVTPYYRYHFKNDRFELIARHAIKGIVDLDALGSSLDIHNQELCYRTDLLKSHDVKISEHLFYTDNEFVFIPLIYAGTITLYNTPIYKYWIGSNDQSVSLKGRIKHYKDSALVETKLIRLYAENYEVISKNLYKQKSLYKILFDLANYQYTNFLLVDKPEKKEIIEFDDYIKEHNNELYNELGDRSKRIRILRLLRFNFLNVLHKAILRAEQKNL